MCMKKELWGLIISPVFAQWNPDDFGGAICGPSTSEIVVLAIGVLFVVVGVFFALGCVLMSIRYFGKPKEIQKLKKLLLYAVMGAGLVFMGFLIPNMWGFRLN